MQCLFALTLRIVESVRAGIRLCASALGALTWELGLVLFPPGPPGSSEKDTKRKKKHWVTSSAVQQQTCPGSTRTLSETAGTELHILVLRAARSNPHAANKVLTAASGIVFPAHADPVSCSLTLRHTYHIQPHIGHLQTPRSHLWSWPIDKTTPPSSSSSSNP